MKAREDCLSQWQAEHAFQIDPSPPQPENLNDLILKAQQEKDMDCFAQFLHFYEPRLNRRVRKFLLLNGYYRIDPERFLDYKLGCILEMVEKLQSYDPSRDADFLTYVHPYLRDSLVRSQMLEESGSFSSLNEYKRVRYAAWLYHQAGDDSRKAIQTFTEQTGLSKMTAEDYVTTARRTRNKVSLYKNFQEEDGEETAEIIAGDDDWNAFGTLWNSEEEQAIRQAFEKLGYREQRLLEERNAICMTCDRVSSLSQRKGFDELAWMFQGSSRSGSERNYQRAVEKLTKHLVDTGVLGVVELRKKKNAAEVYEYCADYDGDWGEIQFDFQSKTAKILKLAEGDTVKSNRYANTAIHKILEMEPDAIPKKLTIPFKR